MKLYLDPGQFNVAPGARKHPPIAWVMLATSAVAVAISLYPLTREIGRLATAKSAQAALVKSMRRDAAEQRKQLAEQNSTAAVDREKIRAMIQESVHMSWDGIFDTLEVAANTVHGGVSIVSLTPTRVSGTATQLNVTALAANTPILLAYVETLKKDPRVSQVELVTQQPDEKVGANVLRFRLQIILNPKIDVPRPVRDASSAPATSASTPEVPSTGGAGFEPPKTALPLGPVPPARSASTPGKTK